MECRRQPPTTLWWFSTTPPRPAHNASTAPLASACAADAATADRPLEPFASACAADPATADKPLAPRYCVSPDTGPKYAISRPAVIAPPHSTKDNPASTLPRDTP